MGGAGHGLEALQVQLHMVRQKITLLDWWKRRLDILKGTENEANRLFAITHTAYDKSGLWPLLKLSALTYYMPPYLQIISNQSRFKKIYYVDGCSACGLLKIKNRYFLGSALLAEKALSNTKDRTFDKLFFIDNDQVMGNALDKIIDHNRSKVIIDNINHALPKLIKEIDNQENTHFLCFVDPEGMELSWCTMEAILQCKGDIIINYMCAGVARNFHYPEKMNDFFGDDAWKECISSSEKHECLFKLYLEKIKRYKPVAVDVKINGDRSFHYHIIFAFGKEGWSHIIETAKKEIENVTLDQIERFLDVQEGKQKTLF